ncbi:Protein NRT1/PTR FAMILY 2.7 [Forsythia ovata]|uniref:Protein NRT1/PTR FAMILY 2.7 n=1 Tax=Forsythia ovata TaxID=205694 RepID=A0ABD1RKH1_9LAMI
MGSSSVSGDGEAQLQNTTKAKHGGWITFPFIIATLAGLTLAGGGWLSNLIVYLIEEFHIYSIDAAQINNVVNGCTSLFPVVGAIIADSFLGSFTIIWISSLISLLGLILFLLMATVDGLRPQNCQNNSSLCTAITPSKAQYAMLYLALTLVAVGLGGSRFTMATMGANQFTRAKHQETYFNWYFFTLYLATVASSTAIVYVEDNVSWAWGFGLCIMANVLGLIIFLLGKRYYYIDRPQGSPFTRLAQVIVASFRKKKVTVSSQSPDYYYGDGIQKKIDELPTKSFRLLNRAAVKIEGDILPNGSIAKPWNICTVQQVEDLKTLFRILPLWSSSILLSTSIGIQLSLSVLQALTMDRHLGPHFKFPAGSLLVFSLVSTSICLSLFDHFLWPTCKKIIGRNSTPLQRIGIGHVFNVASMAVSALVEMKRLATAHSHDFQGSVVPLSVFWLVPQLVIVGIGEAFHFPGQVALYYQEFPTSLKSMATAMISMLIGIGFYLSTAVIDLFRRVTTWLPNDINNGKLDNMYWVVAVLGVINFGYYLLCACLYEYKNVETVETDEIDRQTENRL